MRKNNNILGYKSVKTSMLLFTIAKYIKLSRFIQKKSTLITALNPSINTKVKEHRYEQKNLFEEYNQYDLYHLLMLLIYPIMTVVNILKKIYEGQDRILRVRSNLIQCEPLLLVAYRIFNT